MMEKQLREIIRYPEVEKMIKLSRVTIWRMIRAGTFPTPVQLGPGSKGFFKDEIVGWQEQRASERA